MIAESSADCARRRDGRALGQQAGDDYIANDNDRCPCDPTNTCDQCPIQFVELPIYGLGCVGVTKSENIVINDRSNQGPVYERRIRSVVGMPNRVSPGISVNAISG